MFGNLIPTAVSLSSNTDVPLQLHSTIKIAEFYGWYKILRSKLPHNVQSILIYLSLIVKGIYLNHAQSLSCNQPVLSYEGSILHK